MRASDRAYQRLRNEILEGTLAAGTLLGEVEQAERLGVSRTPLREALSRLTADGLADQTQGRGTVVSSVSLDDVDLLFELRLPLEVQAARLAAQRGDAERFTALAERFSQVEEALAAPDGAGREDQEARCYDLAEELDEAIAEAVDNSYLTGTLRGLRVHLVRVRRLARDEPARLVESAREHRTVCTAIASADGETAAAAMLIHLRRSLAYITDRSAASADGPKTRP
ncbi:GntR family transcriptional regulator [Nesterenkonia xinjiangensis]|uniref:DNA-binding GntR family transcriptional regulator n=1 Tax=Nesterenkonia xinjiangensis TaxID=225327 RepID=A0A7Z0GJ61_9MICC|nr:GntR family transcriptional regulator [Nesterenkonia xinjiangensis]NYJ76733.1 DNA-binding GntR family transcriptional regulator [Nesterenkonia xinjiangensis]